MKISFVIPAYNEALSIKTLYEEIIAHTTDYSYEIIFIDDGSDDDTFEVIRLLASRDSHVKAIRFRRNFGKAAGLQQGFEMAAGDVVFTMDADLQDDPAEIPRFVNKLNEGYDLVTGWKVKRQDPLHKTFPSLLWNTLTSKVFGLKLHDYNCGFKAYKKEVVKEIELYGEMHRYTPALAIAKGFKVGEIPVHHRKRTHGKSKYGIERYLRGILDMLTVRLVTGYSRSPLYFFGGVGSVLGGAGMLISIYLTIAKFCWGMSLSNRPLLFLGILLILAGLQLFSIGLIGELLVNKTRAKQKNKDVSIKETLNSSFELDR